MLLCAAAVSGCRVGREAEARTEYRYIVQRDSVTVEMWDTVRVEVRGDTVRVFEKLHEREYYSTIYRDTLRSRDTVVIERQWVQAAADKNKKRLWPWFAAGFAIGVVLTVTARFLIKLYLKK